MLLFLTLAHALAAPPPADHPRLSGPLRTAYRLVAADPMALEAWQSIRAADAEGLSVMFESPTPDDLAVDLERLGATIEAVTSYGVQAWVAYEDLGVLADLEGVTHVREPYMATAKVVTSGVVETGADAWQALGFAGHGVKVAVLDKGFEAYEGLLGSELPKQVSTDLDPDIEASEHGTAVAEIVHDMAPDAELLLYQFTNEGEFLDALDDLKGRHVDVVNASIGFDNIWPADGTSPMSEAVDDLVASGTVWVGAAGNETGYYAIGSLTDLDRNGQVEIAGVEGIRVFAEGVADAEGKAVIHVSFRWSEPMDDAHTDIDLIAFNDDGTECTRSEETQGAEWDAAPYEMILETCTPGVDGAFRVVPFVAGTPDLTALEGFLYAYDGIAEDSAAVAVERTLTLPADARGAIAVGACDAEAGTAIWYSSRGPTEDGRIKPDICGPTGVDTVSEGSFGGTSAASPHVAGLAVLGVEVLGANDPDAVRTWLTDNALDLGEPGADNTFGAGAAQAGPTPLIHCGCGLSSLKGAWLVVGSGLWVRRRRGPLRTPRGSPASSSRTPPR